jgi:cold shock protein
MRLGSWLGSWLDSKAPVTRARFFSAPLVRRRFRRFLLQPFRAFYVPTLPTSPYGTIFCAPRALPASFHEEHAMPTGVVKWFNETKGFGFIKPDDGGADVFAHYSGIKSKGFRTLKENQRVEYQVQQGQKGPQAVEIVPLA